MISNESNKSQGCAGWLKWLIGSGLALVAAGGSIVAILEYLGPPQSSPVIGVTVVPPPESPRPPDPTNTPLPDLQGVSPGEWQTVEDFLSLAIVSEITAYQYGDPSYATLFYGDALATIQRQIADLNSRGILLAARFDYDNSYIFDIRPVQNNRIEVDSCEYWANDYYDRQTGVLLGSDSWALVPQTIVIEYLNGDFYITSVAFYTGQAFCY